MFLAVTKHPLQLPCRPFFLCRRAHYPWVYLVLLLPCLVLLHLVTEQIVYFNNYYDYFNPLYSSDSSSQQHPSLLQLESPLAVPTAAEEEEEEQQQQQLEPLTRFFSSLFSFRLAHSKKRGKEAPKMGSVNNKQMLFLASHAVAEIEAAAHTWTRWKNISKNYSYWFLAMKKLYE